MIIVLTGAPGAGKGTQADFLAERIGYRKFSTGDALRKHIKDGTAIGKIAGDLMAKGEFVPDDILFQIIKAELGNNPKEKILLDGYPRNLAQAQTLETLKTVHPVKIAIQLEVDRDELINRLSGRRVCGKCGSPYHVVANPSKKNGICDRCGGELVHRPDDNAEAVANRLDIYEKNTRPILDFYKAKGLFKKVDGTGTPEDIFKRLQDILKKTIN
jgi:adenylate kinase